ncbi:MAG: hypothetical protein JWO80_5728 [Bryobacterales bacterium]|nr:hypothetical protein [Bryobacterales bacterium]
MLSPNMGRLSSLVTLFVVFLSTFGHHRGNTLIPGTGLILCFVWHSLVESYKNFRTAKSAVISEPENHLPVALAALIAEPTGWPRAVARSPAPHNVACAPDCRMRFTVTPNEASCFSACSLWRQ